MAGAEDVLAFMDEQRAGKAKQVRKRYKPTVPQGAWPMDWSRKLMGEASWPTPDARVHMQSYLAWLTLLQINITEILDGPESRCSEILSPSPGLKM